MKEKVYMVPNPPMPCENVIFNKDLCINCNTCVEVCRIDVLMPNPGAGNTPIILYPEECWFCGCCVEHCPKPGAIKMNHPLRLKIGWKRKSTGELFRVGMKNPPPPNKRPPVG